MFSSKLKWIASLVAGALLLAACAPPPPPPDPSTIIQVNVTGTANQNPDKNGSPKPVIVHIYALKPGAPFDIGDPEALNGGELGPLAETMNRLAKMVITPGSTQKKVFELPDGFSDIGITAAFRNFDSAAWRASKPIKQKDVTLLKATIGSNAVTIE